MTRPRTPPSRPDPALPAVDGAHATALQTSETRYRRLFEAAQDGILIINAVSAQIEDANPYFIHLLGYTLDEVLGK